LSSNRGYRRLDVSRFKAKAHPIGAGTIELDITENIGINADNLHEFAFYFDACNVVLGVDEEIIVKCQQLVQSKLDDKLWHDVGVVTEVDVTSDGTYGILMSDAIIVEAESLPTAPNMRLVITTGATSTLDIQNVTYNEKIP
jgi:hypothetical protein